MKFGLEAKVGVFIVSSIVLLTVLGISFGKITFGSSDSYNVTFEIDNANGLKTGTKVYFRGIRVGLVKEVVLKGEKLFATIELLDQYKIPNNVDFSIVQAGFVGEKSVELVRSKTRAETGMLLGGDIYSGNQASSSLENVMGTINVMAEQITELTKAINEIVSNDDSKKALKETLVTINQIVQSLDRIVNNNEKGINETIKHIDDLAISLTSFSNTLDKLIMSNSDNITDALVSVQDISKKLDKTISNIERITTNLASSDNGTLGMLINDNKTKEDIQQAVAGVRKIFSRVDDYKLYLTFGGDYIFNQNVARGYANLRLYTAPNSFYHIGISNKSRKAPTVTNVEFKYTDATGVERTGTYVKEELSDDALAFSLQYGHVFYKLFGIRVGIFDSAIGAAFDVYPLKSNTLSLSLEAYDLRFNRNNSKFSLYTRAYVRWSFFDNFFVLGGVEDIFSFNKIGYTVGIGVQFMDDDLKYFATSIGSAVK